MFFTQTEIRIILINYVWLHWEFILWIPVTSLEKYYIVCKSALMFFTQTEFRIILVDVTGDPKTHILNGHFLDRTTKVNKKR